MEYEAVEEGLSRGWIVLPSWLDNGMSNIGTTGSMLILRKEWGCRKIIEENEWSIHQDESTGYPCVSRQLLLALPWLTEGIRYSCAYISCPLLLNHLHGYSHWVNSCTDWQLHKQQLPSQKSSSWFPWRPTKESGIQTLLGNKNWLLQNCWALRITCRYTGIMNWAKIYLQYHINGIK